MPLSILLPHPRMYCKINQRLIRETSTWGFQNLSYTRARCDWSWWTHRAVAVSQSIHLQRTPCHRRPQMSCCEDPESDDTHRSSSPPGCCSLNSPVGLRWLLGDRETGKEEMSLVSLDFQLSLFCLMHFSLPKPRGSNRNIPWGWR